MPVSTTPYLDRLEEYVAAVLAGTIPTSTHVRMAVERHRRDREDPRFSLDVGRLEEVLGFIETLPYCRGDKTGEPFELLPWQVFVLGSLVAWQWSDTGHRRYTFAILELARGQGKTTMMAALMVYELLRGSDGGHLFCFGTAERVALLAFDDVKGILRRMGEDTGRKNRPRRTIDGIEWDLGWRDIRSETKGSSIKPLCAKEQTLDGLDPTIYLADECAEYSTGAFNKLYTATVKRRDSLGVCITTPGDSDQTLYFEYRSAGIAALEQEHDDPSSFYYICGVDEEHDIDDVSQWPAAMPSLGVTCQLDDMVRRYEKAKHAGPSHVRAFRRFHLCQWVGATEAYLSVELIDQCKGTPPDLKGRRAWAGLDLSKSRDMSSLVAVIEGDDGELWIKGQHWYPEDTASERQGAWRMPILDWGRDERVPLTLVPGGVIDYEMIVEAVRQLHRDYQLEAVWHDPLMAGMIDQVLQRDGIQIDALRQSIQYLSPGTILTEELFVEKRIRHDGDPVLRQCLQNARAYTDCNSNMRLDKKRSDGLIDPAMALIMAVSAWNTISPESQYEEHDLRVFG